MTELNMFKSGEKMNTINHQKRLDIDILKALLPQPAKSIYDLKSRLRANYPTLRRHIPNLVKDGFIDTEKILRKDGKPDERGGQSIQLSFKGLVRLILEADLQVAEIDHLVDRILKWDMKKTFPVLERRVAWDALTKTFHKAFEQMRPRINLQYYDEQYVRELVLEKMLIDVLMGEVSNARRKIPDRERRNLEKLTRQSARQLDDEMIRFLRELCDSMEKKRAQLNQKISYLKNVLQFIGDHRQ